jgi:transcriptional regulator with XRE-family HTH domain
MELRRLRDLAGITIEQVAERLDCSASKVSRIETGQSGVSPREVRDILAAYEVPAAEVDALLQMAREATQKGWWQLYGAVLTSAYVGLEAAADAVRSYEALVVPGLLQTEEYARAMILAGHPDIDATAVDQRVRVRMNRQTLLSQDEPLDCRVVLDEAVLHRPVGGYAVMRRQLDHLCKVAGLPNVTLRVLPFSAGAHAGMDGTFTILLYDGSPDLNFVFASNAVGGLFLEKDEEIQKYLIIFERLCSYALPPDETVAMITGLAREK